MPDAELTQLLADPQFRQLVATHAQSNPERDPLRRVGQAVFHAVSKLKPGHEKNIATRAVGYAQKTLHASRNISGQGNSAGGADRRLPAGARLAHDGHHYVSDPKRPGKYLKVIPKQQGGAEVARLAHNQKVDGSNPSPATNSQGRGIDASPAGAGGNLRDVLLVRHGETDMNSSATSGNSVDKIRGHKDIPLNEAGKQQAAKTGDEMARAGIKPDAMATSDLCRAKLTAQIISQKLGVPINDVTDGLRPWDAGKLTGQNSEKAVPVMAQYAQHKPQVPLPGGESFNAFTGRFFTHTARILQQHPGLVMLVAHHRNERTLHAWRAAGFPADGKIDLKTFNKKGEATGAAQRFQIPLDRLVAAAQYLQQHGGNVEPANFDAATQNEKPGQE